LGNTPRRSADPNFLLTSRILPWAGLGRARTSDDSKLSDVSRCVACTGTSVHPIIANMEGTVPPIALRGRLSYVGNDTRLQQCPCEPASNPPLNALLAVKSGVPDDLSGASNYLKNLGWTAGSCVEVQGTFATIGGNVRAFYFLQIKNCPTGPCNE
jgi:hypothetical protein